MHLLVKPAKLQGTVFVSGNKNSALPVIAASLINGKKVKLLNIPNIVDVNLFLDFLRSINVEVKYSPRKEILHLDYSQLENRRKLVIKDPGKLTKIRAVILLLAALAVRFERVIFKGGISGCTLGSRPLTTHFENLRKFGFKISYSPNEISLIRPKISDNLNHDFVSLWQSEQSVTATEVALIIAAGLKRKTIIYNAACEPHVQDTAEFLQLFGHQVDGIGTNRLIITPTQKEAPAKVTFTIRSDHHEITTYLAADLLSKGNIRIIHNLDAEALTPITRTFEKFGLMVKTKKIKTSNDTKEILEKGVVFTHSREKDNSLYESRLIKRQIKPNNPINGTFLTIKPHPWPGLPVDILPLFVPIAAYSETPILFHNWMYDGALFWTLELRKAGVRVVMLDPHRVLVAKGPYNRSATFEAPYIIRATIALVLYAMSLGSESTVLNADTIERAHPYFTEKLRKLGADFKKLS